MAPPDAAAHTAGPCNAASTTADPARYTFGWTLVRRRITVHLVRLTDPPSGSSGFVSTAPLHAGNLAWLIVARGAAFPALGPQGKDYFADFAILVETARPRFVVAVTI